MQQTFYTSKKLSARLILTIGIFIFSCSAHAGFFVIDDDLIPAAVAVPETPKSYQSIGGNKIISRQIDDYEHTKLKALASIQDLSTRDSLAQSQAMPKVLVSSRTTQNIERAVQVGEMRPSEALLLFQILGNSVGSNSALAFPAHKGTPDVGTQSVSESSEWEILETDKTLQETLMRWGKSSNWTVEFQNVPLIKNDGRRVTLSANDFLKATEYVLSKASQVVRESGVELSVTAYTNRVLLISGMQAQQ